MNLNIMAYMRRYNVTRHTAIMDAVKEMFDPRYIPRSIDAKDRLIGKIIQAAEWDDGGLYTIDGVKAVKIVFGYATGNEPGFHNFANSFALAELGVLENGQFVEDVYTEKNAPSSQVVGIPRVWKKWSPEDSENVDWDTYNEWVKETVSHLLR